MPLTRTLLPGFFIAMASFVLAFPVSGFSEERLPDVECDIGEAEFALFEGALCFMSEGEPTKFIVTTVATVKSEEEETEYFSWAKPQNKDWRYLQDCRWEPLSKRVNNDKVVLLRCSFGNLEDGETINKSNHKMSAYFGFDDDGSIYQISFKTTLSIEDKIYSGGMMIEKGQSFGDVCQPPECKRTIRTLEFPKFEIPDDIMKLDFTFELPVKHRESGEIRSVELTYRGKAIRDPSIYSQIWGTAGKRDATE